MNWKEVPLPLRMQQMEKDIRGYPIPFIVVREVATGKPRFQINDDRLVKQCLENHLCAVCGQHMPANDRWLVGGPMSAFHPRGAYLDTPAHHECNTYALQVCPYLAAPKYLKRLDPNDLNPVDYGLNLLVDQNQFATVNERPAFFVAVQTNGYHVNRDVVKLPNGTWAPTQVLVPNRPFKNSEYWLQGQQISVGAAILLWQQTGPQVVL